MSKPQVEFFEEYDQGEAAALAAQRRRQVNSDLPAFLIVLTAVGIFMVCAGVGHGVYKALAADVSTK